MVKMRKKVLCLLALALVGSLMFSSCKDNENVIDNPENPEEEFMEKSSDRGEALLSFLSATAELDTLPDNWYKNNYTVEPTVGFVKDEANPYVRYIAVTNAKEANEAFKRMTAANITDEVKSDNWYMDGIGSLKFTLGNQPDLFATVDVNVRQMPHLTKLCFVPASVIGNNGSFDGFPYYQIGDIVYDEKEKTYWICARPTAQDGEHSKSHWISFNLLDTNFKKLTKKDYVDLSLPYDLGAYAPSAEHIKNILNFFKGIAPGISAFNNSDAKFEDKTFSGVTVVKDTLKTIADYWNYKEFLTTKFKDKIFPNAALAYLIKAYTRQSEAVNVFFHGYSTSPGVYLISTTIKNIDSKYDQQLVKFNWPKGNDTQNYNFKKYTLPTTGADELSYIRKLQCTKGSQEMPSTALVIRYKTGSEISGKSASMFTSNDYLPAKSFNSYNKDIKDIFVVRNLIKENKNYEPLYVMGSMVKKKEDDKKGVSLICVKSGHKSYDLPLLRTASFFYPEYKEELDSKNLKDIDVKVAMFHILNAYASNVDTKTKLTFTGDYKTSLDDIWNKFLNGSQVGVDFTKKAWKQDGKTFTLSLSCKDEGSSWQQYTLSYNVETKKYKFSKFTGEPNAEKQETCPKVTLIKFEDFGTSVSYDVIEQTKADALRSAEEGAKAFNTATFE